MKKLWQAVKVHLKTLGELAFNPQHLLATNVILAATLSGLGDVVAQHLTSDRQQWNRVRSLEMTAAGVTMGAYGHWYYDYLERKLPGRTFTTAVKKVFVDQVVFTPVATALFLVTIAVLQRASHEQFLRLIRNKWWPLYRADCLISPATQFVNYSVVPHRFRVLYDNVISLGCSVYKSYLSYDYKPKRSKPDK